MPDVRSRFQHNSFSRKHVHCTIFLNVAAVFNNNFAPVAANGSSRTDVAISANNYITSNCSLRTTLLFPDGRISVFLGPRRAAGPRAADCPGEA